LTGFFRHILFLTSLGLLLFACSAAAQTVELNPKEQALLQTAEDSLELENYQYASQIFSQLLSLHNDELYFRLKYAECLVYLNSDLNQAIDYLKTVTQSGKMPEAYYYLGLANHYRYMFDKALNYYNQFLQSDLSSKEKLPVHRQITMAENGKKLVEYAYLLNVIDNKRLTINDFFYSYNLENMGGRFVRKHPDFQSRYDRKREKSPIMFISNDNDYILFSSYGKRGKTGRDIYEVKRQSDGEWGEPQELDKIINTTEDEAFAYLHPDGKQLFFCSKGHNSMGGYDIFHTRWNEKTQNWGIPKNMDFPINSPMDDMLYVNDSANNYAIFASRRDSENDRVNIYKILINKDPEKRKIENMQDLIKTSKLEVNILASELETRDNSTHEEQFDTETEPDDSTELILANDDRNDETVSPELKTYNNKRNQLQENLQRLSEIKESFTDDQNQYKQLVSEAWTSEDTLLAVAGLDAIKTYDNKQTALNADIEAFESMLQELNLKENELPDKPTQTKLNALADNLERIVYDYNEFDLINTLETKSEIQQKKINALNSEMEAITQLLKETQGNVNIDNFSEDAIASHENSRKTQNQKIEKLSELAYDYQSLKSKQEALETTLDLIKTNKENLTPVDKPIKIPYSEIQTAEQKLTNARLNRLNKEQREIERTNRENYGITPWFEQSEYQSAIQKTITQIEENPENDIPKTLIADDPKIETAIAEREKVRDEIKALKAQIESADELQKPDLWRSINEQISRFEENNETIKTIISETDLITENEEIITEINSENDQQTTERPSEKHIKYTDVFTSETEREQFVKATQKSINAITEKQKETKNAVRNFNETQASQLSAVKPINSYQEIERLRNSHKELIQLAIHLNEKALDEEKAINTFLSNELSRISTNESEFSNEITEQIKEATRLLNEAESFKISAKNTENTIRKMDFLDKGNEKIRESNQILRQLSEDITGVEIVAESSDDRPNTNTLKSIIQETNDQLTQIETPEPFINSVDQNKAPLIIEKDEKAREYAFQLTDSLFNDREIVRTIIKENPSSNDIADLRRQEDAIRYEIAEEISQIYNEAQPVIETRIAQNQKTIEYLKDLGLIDERQIAKLSANPKLTNQSPVSNTSPIQIHRNITRLSNHINAQIDLLHSQEALINTVRTSPTKPIPGAWYDLVNKMNRLAEPKIPVDKNFTDIQLDTYEALGIALPPNERKTKEKLEKKIAKSEGKINEIQQTISEIRNAEDVGERDVKKLSKLEEKQTKASIQQTEYKVEKQGWYFNLHEKSTSENPLAETVYAISDSLNQIALNQLEIIEKSNLEPKVKLKQLQYVNGLLIEANQLKQSVEMYDRNEISDDALIAYIKTYRPSTTDINADEELIADNSTDKAYDDSSETESADNQITETTDTETNVFDETETEDGSEQNTVVSDEIEDTAQDENAENNTDEFIEIETEDTDNQITETTNTETNVFDETETEDGSEQNIVSDEIIDTAQDENTENETDEFIEIETEDTDNQITETTDTETNVFDETETEDGSEQNTVVSDEIEYTAQDENQIKQQDDDAIISNEDILYYRIQMVAYSRPLNDTAFRGISPVIDEQVTDRNIYRYLAGKFYNGNSWRDALPLVKAQGFTDAFPVAYLNRERISLARARDLMYLEKDLPAEFRILTGNQDDFIAQQNETNAQVDIAAANQITPVPVLEDSQSTFYSIQLGAFGKVINQDNIRGVSADFYHREGNGYFKYYNGRFQNYEQALQQKGIVNRSIPDAFIVAFSGGERVSRAEAEVALGDTPLIDDTQVQDVDIEPTKIRYRIQIGAFANPMPLEQLQNYRESFAPYPIGSINKGNITIYFVDGFESYETAGQALKIMVRPLVGDAFVTAWRGDTKITIREALQAD